MNNDTLLYLTFHTSAHRCAIFVSLSALGIKQVEVNHKIISYHKYAKLRVKLANRSCYVSARHMLYNDSRDRKKECMYVYDGYQNDFPKNILHM